MAWSIRHACRATASHVVRIWQANIGKTIIGHVPMTDGAVQETGDFELDGVTFPAAEVQLEFMDPADEEEGAGWRDVPDRQLVDDLEVPGIGTFKATMINAGIPTIFLNAEAIGYTGTELQDASTATRRRCRCSRPCAPTAPCAWA
jgi:2-methylaconitate cis-trans-isomerase PrpF